MHDFALAQWIKKLRLPAADKQKKPHARAAFVVANHVRKDGCLWGLGVVVASANARLTSPSLSSRTCQVGFWDIWKLIADNGCGVVAGSGE